MISCFSKNIFSYLAYYSKILFYRLFKRKHNVNIDINIFLAEISYVESNKVFLPIKIQNNDIEIMLATQSIIINQSYDWNLVTDDTEDIESLHRFNWIKYFLSKNNITENDIKIIDSLIISWFNINSFDSTNLRYTPYTMSERLSLSLIHI